MLIISHSAISTFRRFTSQLNLSERSAEMAQEVFCGSKTGHGYEAAKRWQTKRSPMASKGKQFHALERFAKARDMFAKEKNLVCHGFLDLYHRAAALHEGRYFEPRRLCVGAAAFFDQTMLSGKPCLHISFWRASPCTSESLPLRNRRRTPPLPGLSACKFRACLSSPLSARAAAQARGDRPAALAAYVEARKALETLRSRLHSKS